jgi:hypothetical protein
MAGREFQRASVADETMQPKEGLREAEPWPGARVIISAWLFEKLSDYHPCIHVIRPKGSDLLFDHPADYVPANGRCCWTLRRAQSVQFCAAGCREAVPAAVF